ESDGKFQLHDENNNIDISLSNVGVGIAQVIPVLVGVLDDRSQSWNIGDFIYIPFQRRDIFAVEQPELHLHPAAQVALGDVFIDAVKNGNRTMLIETHSEHLLLRIMRRMRETFEDRIEENRFPVTPDDIAVLFVEWHDSQTIIREMPVNERGELVKAWPGGFFEEDIEEVLA
ncbi:MAG: AAA family ATPase, partial [Gemmatimonadota bacterium]|nr:AAA family ATPase [Gemmatimonadota bacterium]